MRESAARAAAARRRPPFRLKDLPAHDDQVPIEGVGDSARICSVCEGAGLGRYVSARSPMHHISVVAVRSRVCTYYARALASRNALIHTSSTGPAPPFMIPGARLARCASPLLTSPSLLRVHLNQMYAKANTARSAAKGNACTVRVAAEMAVTGAGVGTMVGAGVGLGQRVGQKPQGYTYGSYAGPSQ